MGLHTEILLVRHGHDDRETRDLTSAGRQHAERAAGELISRGLGANALLLAAGSARAQQTALIITNRLGVQMITGSATFNRAGSYPGNVESLDALLESEIAAAGMHPDDLHSGLIVVTSSPLIAAAIGIYDPGRESYDRITHGSVTPYQPGTWVRPAAAD